MAVHVLAMVAGFALLAFMADVFVVGAARLAASLGVPAIVVGAVVIGFGTSLPELATAALGASHGSIGIAAGSIIGSSTINATLVIGAAALVAMPIVSPRVLRREVPVALAAILVFAALARGGLTRIDGVVLMACFAGALAVVLAGTLTAMRRKDRGEDDVVALETSELEAEVAAVEGHSRPPYPGPPAWRAAARSLVGLAGTLAGAEVLVWGALGIARDTGLDQGVVGVTVVALGTALPELVSAIQSARRGHTELVLGNVLGSNLFNALCVGGAASLIGPGRVPAVLRGFPIAMMVGAMTVLSITLVTGRQLRRAEAVVLLLAYVATVAVELS